MNLAPPLVLSARHKVWRTLVVLFLGGMFLAGTFVGQDEWWPFSPWRMYSTSTAPTGAVISTLIEVQTSAAPGVWTEAPINPNSVGLNRAEVEGRMARIVRDPAMLGTLAASHARLRPHEPAWIAIRVVVRNFELLNGALTGKSRDDQVAVWNQS